MATHTATTHTHQLVTQDDDTCTCGAMLCPDTLVTVEYDPTTDTYWHSDGSTCFLHTAVPCEGVPGAFRRRVSIDPLNPLPTRCAEDRMPDDPCQRGTVGCSVDHQGDENCETW